MDSLCFFCPCYKGNEVPVYPPTRSELCAHRVCTVAASILAISIISIVVVALITNYPTAPKIFYTAFGIAAGLALVAIVLINFKRCRSEPVQPAPAPVVHKQAPPPAEDEVKTPWDE